MMLGRVEKYIEAEALLAPGATMIIAVSGGPDSVCLLDVLVRLKAHWDWSLVVAHLNHGLRGEAARGDALFVRRLAAELELPFISLHLDMRQELEREGGSLQALGRRRRQEFFRQVATTHGAETVLLAHHADDQAETILLHLLRGAGTEGLLGMEPRQRSGDGLTYVRPLLKERKRDILAYLKARGRGYRLDASNAAPDYARNYLRHEVLPALGTINPHVTDALLRLADILGPEDDYLNEAVAAALPTLFQMGEPALVDLAVLSTYPLAIKRRLLRSVWECLQGSKENLTLKHVDQALALLNSAVGSVVLWPGLWQVRRGYEHLAFHESAPSSMAGDFVLPIPGRLHLPEGGYISATRLSVAEFKGFSPHPHVAYCLCPPGLESLTVRFWQPGDYFYPLGMTGRKKLQDFFTDLQIEKHERHHTPLVLHQGEILWVAGKRLDNRWRIKSDSRELLRLEYRVEGE